MVKKVSSKAYRPNKLSCRLFGLSLFDQKGLICDNLLSQLLNFFSYSDIWHHSDWQKCHYSHFYLCFATSDCRSRHFSIITATSKPGSSLLKPGGGTWERVMRACPIRSARMILSTFRAFGHGVGRESIPGVPAG